MGILSMAVDAGMEAVMKGAAEMVAGAMSGTPITRHAPAAIVFQGLSAVVGTILESTTPPAIPAQTPPEANRVKKAKAKKQPEGPVYELTKGPDGVYS